MAAVSVWMIVYAQCRVQERQRGALKQMMYSIQQAIEIVRDSFTLIPGDVIFTGTGISVPLLYSFLPKMSWICHAHLQSETILYA